MIKALRKTANWIEEKKCNFHFWWNAKLESLKTECKCARSTK